MLTEEQFASGLRHALRHLYDLDALRTNHLMDVLGLAGRPKVASALVAEITRAIESLKPEAGVPAHSRNWRVYEILLYRYVQQCGQQEVANQLGLSIRQLRREEQRATEHLARRLAERLKIDFAPPDGDHEPPAQSVESASPPFSRELMWLRSAPPTEAVDLAQMLPTLAQLAEPMALRHNVSLGVANRPDLPALAGHTVAVKQLLLSLLNAAMRRTPGGRVTLSANVVGWQVEIRIRGIGPQPKLTSAPDDAASLEMAKHLASTCDGHLTLSCEGEPFDATVTLPAAEQLPILVIDDNVDALQLFQRYASGTRYRIVGVRDASQAIEAAGEIAPRVIVLDVMMPEVDGWELLGRLRQHPRTSNIPVIVCTILAEEEMAFSLGASGFVRKPVTRQDFLSALDREIRSKQAARSASE